ncbi:unnamed protein product [Cuscuta campestris]|uniref:J domain-containing protein n=1 Tax=Cuscuta campestris TaxID=132261 RepID=A0A484L7B1_9ASTE|nr:unnamed protein product [Cuscuta campestris]
MGCNFRSPINPSAVFPDTQNLQSNARSYPERPLAADSASSFGSSDLASSTSGGFKFSYVSEKCAKSSRPKPRMAKIRKHLKKSEPVGDGFGYNPFKLGPESSGSDCSANDYAGGGRGSDCSGLNVNRGSNGHIENSKQVSGAEHGDGNPLFVFGANKSQTRSITSEFVFGSNQSRPRSMSSVEGDGNVPEATKSSSVPNSIFENAAHLHSNLGQKASDRQPGPFKCEKFGVGESVLTSNVSTLQRNDLVSNKHSKSISLDNSSGDSKSSSGVDFNFQYRKFGAKLNGPTTNLCSGKKESSGGGRSSVPEMNETAASIFQSQQSFSTDSGLTGFVFGANDVKSSLYSDMKAQKPIRNWEACKGGKLGSEVASEKGDYNEVFVFKGSNELGKTSCAESSKFDEDMHNSKNKEKAHIYENHGFVFCSPSVCGADVSELSNEFNSLSMSANLTNNLSGKLHSNIKNTGMFFFGSNQNPFGFSTQCGNADKNFNNLHENVNTREPGYDENVGKVETAHVTSGIEERKTSSLGVGNQNVMTKSLNKITEFNCSEKISSWRSSDDMHGKENQPIKLNDLTFDGTQFHVSLEDVGVQVNNAAAVAPSLNKDDKTDQAGFKSFQFGMEGTCRDINAFGSSEAFSFKVNLCSGLSKKMVHDSRKHVSDKKVKKKTLSRKNMAKDQADQKNNESPGCGSPMDFSPYQNTNSEAKKKCHEPSETYLEVDSENHLDDEKKNVPSAESSLIDGLTAIRRQYKKKYRTKGCNLSNETSQQKSGFVTQMRFPRPGCNDSSDVQSGATSRPKGNGVHLLNADERHAKQEFPDFEACEKCRIRGNLAYKAGDLSKAEEFYSKGIRSFSHLNIPERCIQPLLLCYSNRAATRMSLFRMREAINDCASAAALDPSFLKVKLRAANCYLLLGDVKEAMENYNSCLESKSTVCLDRRIAIEASNGLQKAEKVADGLHLSVELLQLKTSDAAKRALDIIAEALCISLYSEKLLELKAEGLCMLRMYDEAIKLCEQTLDIAEKNYVCLSMENINDTLRLWRWRIMSKSYYHLGKLEAALHLIEKQEQLLAKDRSGNNSQESSIPLGTVIRELLDRKKAGNEAFESKKFAEALDHYNAAISSSVESRPFAAICFCNLAAAHQSLGQIIDAIADCSIAMALDENYSKAASRRATLHEMIRDYAHAVTDLQMLISLLENQLNEKAHEAKSQDRSSSSNTLKELKKARQCLSSIQEKAKSEIPLDLYLILGIRASDPESDIKKAYKKAALKHHPDKAVQFLAKTESMDGQLRKDISNKVQKDADRLFKMIGEAYAVLSNSEKRSDYDREEEMRSARKQKNMNCSGNKSSESYNSPFGRSSYRRYGQESWKTYGNSYSDW